MQVCTVVEVYTFTIRLDWDGGYYEIDADDQYNILAIRHQASQDRPKSSIISNIEEEWAEYIKNRV